MSPRRLPRRSVRSSVVWKQRSRSCTVISNRRMLLGLFVLVAVAWLPQFLSHEWVNNPHAHPAPLPPQKVPPKHEKHEQKTIETAPVVHYKRRTNSTLTTTEMFVALSDMLPEFRASCPSFRRYRAQWFDFRDLQLCYNIIRRASDQKQCIIYNFGVGKHDPFLRYMGDMKHLRCQVYAFDPFLQANTVKGKYGPNIHFYEIGLWNGYSDRTVRKTRTGQLMSLGEIQQMLGHASETRISLFRSDCEGCEYGWVQYAMEHDESFFSRVDQMFLEIHTVPIRYMDSIDLEWKEGMPPAHLLEPVYEMLTKYFRVLDAAVNPGAPTDRNRVPAELYQQGVLQYPCCRELNLINNKLAVPLTKDPDAIECGRPNPTTLQGFTPEFQKLFHGHHYACPRNEKPQCYEGRCFCNKILQEDVNTQHCLVYFFGNLGDAKELKLLKTITTLYPLCSVWVFDPRVDIGTGTILMEQHGINNVIFHPWALYSGSGTRRFHVNHANGTTTLKGELYTMAEITTSWTRIQSVKRKIQNPSPSRISLLRIDWSIADPCVWQKEILSYSSAWWGEYKGNETVQQLM